MNEERKINEDILGPYKVDAVYIGLTSLGSIISGFIGGIVIFIAIFFLLQKTGGVSGVYPFLFSLVGLFSISMVAYLNLFLNKLIHPEKYQRGSVAFTQMTIFLIMFYIFITPLYMFVGGETASSLIYVFIIHVTISIFGTSLIGEILSSYRYILIGIYGSFIGLFFAIFMATAILIKGGESYSNSLYSLIGAIIIINFFIATFRSIFEFIYYKIYQLTGTDMLGDIFYQIELEEKEEVKKAQENLEKF
ncbi:MAG: hypothetical protein PHF26_02210 [Candidatus Gracilibacteria bacterium]|nr:hypothetical protein [Candidatus Gracilibacteria bacterium]